MRVFTAGSLFWEYSLLSIRFSLISAVVSQKMGLLLERSLLDFEMALSTVVLISGVVAGGGGGGGGQSPLVTIF